jgi:hypothetical protein
MSLTVLTCNPGMERVSKANLTDSILEATEFPTFRVLLAQGQAGDRSRRVAARASSRGDDRPWPTRSTKRAGCTAPSKPPVRGRSIALSAHLRCMRVDAGGRFQGGRTAARPSDFSRNLDLALFVNLERL